VELTLVQRHRHIVKLELQVHSRDLQVALIPIERHLESSAQRAHKIVMAGQLRDIAVEAHALLHGCPELIGADKLQGLGIAVTIESKIAQRAQLVNDGCKEPRSGSKLKVLIKRNDEHL
jgi:hypothetical protein